MNYVIFHDDLDGYMSAAIAKYSLPETASFYVTQYNKPFPIDLEKVSKDDELLIVDFSYSKETTLELQEKFGKVITIDHHDSAFEKFSNSGPLSAVMVLNTSENWSPYCACSFAIAWLTPLLFLPGILMAI